MKNLIFISIVLMMFSCDNDEQDNAYVFDVNTGFQVVSQQGDDLLSPSVENSFNHEGLKILYLLDNEEVEFYDSKLTNPKAFDVTETENGYILGVSVQYIQDNHSEFKIYWTENDFDLVKCKVEETSNVTRIINVWVNNEMVWDFYDHEPRVIKLMK